MADGTKPDFHSGDKASMNYCPRYHSACRHTMKIIGEPVLKGSKWVVPTRFYCIGRQTANVYCEDLIKIRRIKVKKSAIVTAVVLGFMGILFLWGMGNYNSLVSARNAVYNSKAKIDTQLTRRYELIDNIVQSVQGSQAQESDVFGKIAEARKVGGQSGASTEQQAQANQTIDTQIALLPRLQEAYPELRSNDQVTKLITELQGTANGIRDARDNYNNTVTNYNTNITSFPKNIFAGMFDFDKAKLFEASAQERVNPKVELDREKN